MAQNYEAWLRKRLTEKRYAHSLAVRERAVELAKIYGADAEKAALAGLLHDCCHSLPFDAQLKIINAHGILLDDFTMAQPQLWHAVAGSLTLRNELGIDDADVISAVRLHTTGAKNMTKLEQAVYLADFTSKDRDYPGISENRLLAEKSPALCMMKSLSYTINTLAAENAPIVRDAWEAYNYFWELSKKEIAE